MAVRHLVSSYENIVLICISAYRDATIHSAARLGRGALHGSIGSAARVVSQRPLPAARTDHRAEPVVRSCLDGGAGRFGARTSAGAGGGRGVPGFQDGALQLRPVEAGLAEGRGAGQEQDQGGAGVDAPSEEGAAGGV